jgi:hypothetical protein
MHEGVNKWDTWWIIFIILISYTINSLYNSGFPCLHGLGLYLRIGRRFEDWTSIRDWTSVWVLHIYIYTLCDKVCRWFSPGTPISTNKTDQHDITEILLKVALNTIYMAVFHFLKSTSINTRSNDGEGTRPDSRWEVLDDKNAYVIYSYCRKNHF